MYEVMASRTMWRRVQCACVVLLALGAARADSNVTIESMQVTFEETHELVVNASVEFILTFAPHPGQGVWPIRVWIKTDGGDTSRPLLVTARRRIGAWTWQLPYRSGSSLLYQLERTLCPDDSVDVEKLDENCESDDPSVSASGEFSLHVGSSCAAPSRVQLRASFVRDWRLPFKSSTSVVTQQGAPRVHTYQFLPEQYSVRLVVEASDDVCATIAVQNYTCPIAESLEEIEISTLRMTVLRSGAMQISRSRYPRGFYVLAVVHDSDAACREEDAPEVDWLWEAAVLQQLQEPEHSAPPRRKALTLHVRASLSREQYAGAAAASLALFVMFYVLFGAFVLAQRLPRWKNLVGPRAVLARKPEEGARSEIDSVVSLSPRQRRRRDSTATFDSSDNSDTDEEDTATGTTTVATVTTPPPAVVAVSTQDETNPGSRSAVSVGTDPAPPLGDGVTTRVDSSVVPGGDDTRRSAIEQSTQTSNGIHGLEAAGEQTEAPRPFGLPARLHVAALARRRARVLAARSDRYLYTLYTVGLFYALPVLQFVAAFQIFLNFSGSLDTCYYNFLCAHPVSGLSDFNHVFSNIGYLLLGALFMLQVRRRRMRRKRKPRDEEYGIPAHYGLLSSLGAAMMMVALLSATYHVCPNALNFQFDTAFMYVLAVLCMVKIYQARHPDINARAHATFGVLAVLILLAVRVCVCAVVWGVLGGGPLFWSVFTVLHVFTFLLLSLRIYYVGQFRLEKQSLAEAARELASVPARGLRPLYSARLVMLLIANAVNWAFALYGYVVPHSVLPARVSLHHLCLLLLFTQSADFASHLLSVLLCNTLLYMAVYLCMKLLHGERPRWATTPALSRHLNHECRVLQFYDSHDLWHFLSAIALYFTFNVLLTWDDGLAAVKRTEIAVF
ncbi:hypothetical protein HW555_009574 [Spodoptera exigua]|uniref:Uncharacterized protein n=1 Tax=Spodoptera exigua TaxID=7107 RepID=A0A835L2D0_SPOEX|nr:hypothetical protein HW555_009574 [Spodoptera exigua]